MIEAVGAVLWDMDGTLADTERYWVDACFQIAHGRGAHWGDEYAARIAGLSPLEAARFVAERVVGGESPGVLVNELIDCVEMMLRREVTWRPGARELLSDIRRHAIPCGLVTGSPERCANLVLARLPEHTFDVIVTADSGVPDKPHPGPYSLAAAQLGVPPRRTVAIEDSVAGARSAQDAGCTVVVVPQFNPMTPREGVVVQPSLEDLNWTYLEGLLAT